jgi:hypothetical protein
VLLCRDNEGVVCTERCDAVWYRVECCVGGCGVRHCVCVAVDAVCAVGGQPVEFGGHCGGGVMRSRQCSPSLVITLSLRNESTRPSQEQCGGLAMLRKNRDALVMRCRSYPQVPTIMSLSRVLRWTMDRMLYYRKIEWCIRQVLVKQ